MEIDHLLATDDNGQIKTYNGDESLGQKVNMWLDTPRGQVWGNAKWGHRLAQLKHEPQDSNTEIAAENSILFDLPIDIPAVNVNAIQVEFTDEDKVNIAIDTNLGLFSRNNLTWSTL